MPTDVRKWPIRAQAAKLLSVSPRTVHRMAVRGEIEVQEDPEGVKRYNPDDVEALGEAESPGSGEDPAKISLQALRASVSHVERLVNLIVDPRERILNLAQDEIVALRSRVTTLEHERSQWLCKYDELQSASLERDVIRQGFERGQARLDRGLQEVAKHGPRLIGQVMVNRRIGQLLESLSSEQVTVLEQSGFLGAEQVQMIRGIRGEGAVKSVGEDIDEPPANDPPAGQSKSAAANETGPSSAGANGAV